MDEEKRTRVKELRNSGRIVEPRKSNDIPFGVRAIQSGIEVDGIWISSQTPPPASSRSTLEHSQSSGSSKTSSVHGSVREDSPIGAVQPVAGGRPLNRSVDLGEHVLHGRRIPAPVPRIVRTSYKPRTSSHLRYGSLGMYDEDVLNNSEARTSPRRKTYAHYPRDPVTTAVELDSSSAADNERSSGASFDSDATLSHRPQSYLDPVRQFLMGPPAQAVPSSSSTPDARRPISQGHDRQRQHEEYFPIPTGSLSRWAPDPFVTPLVTPAESPELGPETHELSHPVAFAGPKQLEGLRQEELDARPVSPFVAGELHINKSVRKVNPGFEVLPAGTFDTPKKFNESLEQDNDGLPGTKRRSSKLQKKLRSSISGRRPSSTME